MFRFWSTGLTLISCDLWILNENFSGFNTSLSLMEMFLLYQLLSCVHIGPHQQFVRPSKQILHRCTCSNALKTDIYFIYLIDYIYNYVFCNIYMKFNMLGYFFHIKACVSLREYSWVQLQRASAMQPNGLLETNARSHSTFATCTSWRMLQECLRLCLRATA